MRIEVATPEGLQAQIEANDPNAGQFAARLRKVARERRKWARREGVGCYRVYDADLPDFACAVDLYEGAAGSEGERFCVVAEYAAPKSIDAQKAQGRFADACAIAPVVLGVPAANVFPKRRLQERGGGQYAQERGEHRVAHAQEGGYTFELDFGGYLDTGLFLDHRTTRLMLGKMARGTRFLNLFAYTGSATVHAAGGGAATTDTVDLSQTYLDRARRNMEANGFSGVAHRFVRADVTEWVQREARETSHRFDLVFCDPPTFSNSKAMGERTWDVQRDHVTLLRHVARLLAPGGTIVFSNNLRTFKLDAQDLAAAGLTAEDITARTIPHDFERNPRIHQCFIITKRA